MKINDNIKEVAKLLPDFMGFIFWPKTKRFFSEKEISIPKIGIFIFFNSIILLTSLISIPPLIKKPFDEL